MRAWGVVRNKNLIFTLFVFNKTIPRTLVAAMDDSKRKPTLFPYSSSCG
jgi:hypothetical protein